MSVFLFLCFEPGFLYVAPVVLELTMETSLPGTWRFSFCLCLPSAGPPYLDDDENYDHDDDHEKIVWSIPVFSVSICCIFCNFIQIGLVCILRE